MLSPIPSVSDTSPSDDTIPAISEGMKIAAAHALAGLISDEELSANYIIPAPFDPRVKDAVASAVAKAAREEGLAQI